MRTLLILVFALILSLPASAYQIKTTDKGKPYYRDSMVVYLAPSAEHLQADFETAHFMWQEHLNYFMPLNFVDDPAVADTFVRVEDIANPDVLGVTTTVVVHATGQILLSEIVIDKYMAGFETILHETGHSWGIGHSDDPTSVMWKSSWAGILTPDDIDAVQQLEIPVPEEKQYKRVTTIHEGCQIGKVPFSSLCSLIATLLVIFGYEISRTFRYPPRRALSESRQANQPD